MSKEFEQLIDTAGKPSQYINDFKKEAGLTCGIICIFSLILIVSATFFSNDFNIIVTITGYLSLFIGLLLRKQLNTTNEKKNRIIKSIVSSNQLDECKRYLRDELFLENYTTDTNLGFLYKFLLTLGICNLITLIVNKIVKIDILSIVWIFIIAFYLLLIRELLDFVKPSRKSMILRTLKEIKKYQKEG